MSNYPGCSEVGVLMTMTAFQRDELHACVLGKPDPILFATACEPLACCN
jgi:hypothetical protein